MIRIPTWIKTGNRVESPLFEPIRRLDYLRE